MKPKKPPKKTKKIDYSKIPIINKNADRTKYSSTQRRAELIAIIEERGSLKLPVGPLSQKYGVSPGLISQDKAIILPYLQEKYRKDADKLVLEIMLAKNKAKNMAIDRGDHKGLNQITDSQFTLLCNLGLVDKAAEKLEARVEGVIDGQSLVDGFRLYQRNLKEAKE